MKFLILMIVAISCFSCSTNPTGPKEPEPVIVPAKGKELCKQACDRMAVLKNADGGIGCDEGKPIQAPSDLACKDNDCSWLVKCPDLTDGTMCVTCTWFCEYSHDNGSYWNTSCIVNNIATCAEIESVCNK